MCVCVCVSVCMDQPAKTIETKKLTNAKLAEENTKARKKNSEIGTMSATSKFMRAVRAREERRR